MNNTDKIDSVNECFCPLHWRNFSSATYLCHHTHSVLCLIKATEFAYIKWNRLSNDEHFNFTFSVAIYKHLLPHSRHKHSIYRINVECNDLCDRLLARLSYTRSITQNCEWHMSNWIECTQEPVWSSVFFIHEPFFTKLHTFLSFRSTNKLKRKLKQKKNNT